MPEFDPVRAALLVMLHEARQFNAAVMREAGVGPFDLNAIRQAEAALNTGRVDGERTFCNGKETQRLGEWLLSQAPTPAPEARKPLTVQQYNAIPELCAIPPSLYESIVRAIEREHGIASPSGAEGGEPSQSAAPYGY